MRLNKYLAETGACSRREADQWIEAGRVTVNGVGKDTLLGRGESLKGVALKTGKLSGRLIPAHNPFLGFFRGLFLFPVGSTRDSENQNNYVYPPPH